MAYPLLELRALLSRADAAGGLVVAVRDGAVDVATPRGLVQARTSGRALAIGERVTIRDGVATARATAERSYVL